MRSWIPPRSGDELLRTVLITEPGLTREQRDAADGASFLFIATFFHTLLGAGIGAMTLLADALIYKPSTLEWDWLVGPACLAGALVGFGYSIYSTTRLRKVANGSKGLKRHVVLAEHQLIGFLECQRDWTYDSPQHRAWWAWAQENKSFYDRIAVPDELLGSSKASL